MSIERVNNPITESTYQNELLYKQTLMEKFPIFKFDNNFDVQFYQRLTNGLEELDKQTNGLITQQFTALAQKCAKEGKKLLIGEDPKLSKTSGICIETGCSIDTRYIYINISEDLVKKAMKDPIYVIQQEGSNIPEIKAIPLGKLVAGQENVNFDDPALIAKCAAYLLFHELFHVNSHHFEFYGKGTLTDPDNFKKSHKFPDHVTNADIDELIAKKNRFDDLRNVTKAKTETEIRIPGEYELLQALYPNKRIMRLYEGKFLDFSKVDVLNAAVKVARFENGPLNPVSDLQQLSENKKLRNKINTFLNDKKVLSKKWELNTDSPYKEFVSNYKSLQKTNKELNDFIGMQKKNSLNFIKVDNSTWEAQANQYMQEITKNLEEIQKQKDMHNGTYIPI